MIKQHKDPGIRFCCRICNRSDGKLVFNKEEIQYIACSCGVTYQVPIPSDTDIYSLYSQGYMDDDHGCKGHSLHFKSEYYESYCKEKDLTFKDLGYLHPSSPESRRLLDVGCANGIFLEYAQQLGYRGEGIDISLEMVKDACQKGLNCRVSIIEELEEIYEIISLWDVLEHLRNPIATLTLRQIHDRLCLRGDLIIQTPVTGVISDSWGADWRYYLPNQHLHLFSQDALFRLLADNGFYIVSWVRFGSGNESGTLPVANKLAMDAVAKRLGIGDTIALWAQKG